MTDTTITIIEPLKQDSLYRLPLSVMEGIVPLQRVSLMKVEEDSLVTDIEKPGEVKDSEERHAEQLEKQTKEIYTTTPVVYPMINPVSIGSKKIQTVDIDPHSSGNLLSKVVIYYHLSNDKNWNIDSYKVINSVSTVEGVVSLNENISENIIKYCMLFVMKSGVPPIWEDQRNVNGGCFSYKVYNKYVVDVWKKMVYAFCGATLMINRENMKYVNGITISPKKNFCILKIWFENLKIQNAEEVVDIVNLSRTGVIFRAFRTLNH